jgi:hypothetical protein
MSLVSSDSEATRCEENPGHCDKLDYDNDNDNAMVLRTVPNGFV